MGLQEAVVHLRPFNLITLFKRLKEQRNQETARDTSATEMVSPRKSELLLAPKESVCLACFSMELGFCITSPLCLLSMCCWPTAHHCWPTEGLEGDYLSLGLEKAGFPGKPRSQLFTRSPTKMSKTVNNLDNGVQQPHQNTQWGEVIGRDSRKSLYHSGEKIICRERQFCWKYSLITAGTHKRVFTLAGIICSSPTCSAKEALQMCVRGSTALIPAKVPPSKTELPYLPRLFILG